MQDSPKSKRLLSRFRAKRQTPGEFVFADPGGSRWRRARVQLAFVGALLLAAAILAVGVLTANPWRGTTAGTYDMDEIIPRGNESLPSVGHGPVERILAVEREADGVWGADLRTGQRVHEFAAEEVADLGQADHAMVRSGYDKADKTITLTFDDGPDRETTMLLLDALSAEGVPASFFVQGRFVSDHPDIIDRMVREGHEVGGHSVHHPQFSEIPRWRKQYEMATTERLIRDAAGVDAHLWRQPYADGESAASAQELESQLFAQRMGYTHIGYDFDTQDWAIVGAPDTTGADIPLPDFSSGASITVLMHDAGGPNREKTVEYVQDHLIPAARDNGYTFTTLEGANSELTGVNAPVQVTWVDRSAAAAMRALHTWPTHFMAWIFIVTVLLTFSVGMINAVLALLRYRRQRVAGGVDPLSLPIVPVTVLLAAYNEETVIERTIRTVLASSYPLEEVLIVDDGSTDSTAAKVRAMSVLDPRVRLVQQTNSGKSVALNNGLTQARGEVVVTIDADTLVSPDTVGNLARNFVQDETGRLGVVAGVVRVGNRDTNILTRWQALEYVTQIGVDRAAQAQIKGIAIVPGACSAWRKDALKSVGGFTSDTLAEDTDLTLTMQKKGWGVAQDDRAYAFTEAPDSLDDLLKQRVRWTYGIMQAMWKHRDLLFNRKFPGLGFYVMPNYVISIAVPLFLLPLTLVMTVVALQSGGPLLLLFGFLLFFVYQAVLSTIAVKLLDEDWKHLLVVPLYRAIFEPLRVYLLYSTAFSALKGVRVRWNRVKRTGTVSSALDSTASHAAGPTDARALTDPASPLSTGKGPHFMISPNAPFGNSHSDSGTGDVAPAGGQQ